MKVPRLSASEAFAAEQVRMLFRGLPRVLLANVAVGVIFFSVHWLQISSVVAANPWRRRELAGWMALVVLAAGFRYAVYRGFLRRGHLSSPRFTLGQFDPYLWLRRFRISVLASAVVWGLGGYLVADTLDPVRLAFTILAIGGLCAGSITALSADKTSALTFLVVTPVPALAKLLFFGGGNGLALALFFIVGVLFVALTSNRTYESMFELIRLRLDSARAAAALGESEQRWKFALEGARAAVWDRNFTTKSEFTSARWQQMLGYGAHDSFDASILAWQEKVHPEDAALVQSALDATMLGQTPMCDVEFRYAHRDGSWIWVCMRGMVLHRDATGAPLRMIGTREDITETKALQTQLQQSQKMQTIGQLAGGIAHDFNNNLTAMMMSLDLLNCDPALSVDARETVAELGRMTDHAAKITAQLLLFARRQTVQTRAFDLRASTQKLAAMLQRLLGEQITLRLALPVTPLYVMADAALVDQAIINLALNARDAMVAGGVLEISISAIALEAEDLRARPEAKPGNFARIGVTDTGTGMTAHVMAHLFEPFFTTKDVGQGTGLGLASVHGMAHQHQGWVSARSVLGQGSTFELYLPMADSLARASAELPKPLDQSQGKNVLLAMPKLSSDRGARGILLVEDEPLVRDSIMRMLGHLGYQVFCAANAAEAQLQWQLHQAQIGTVITDLVMPGADNGLALARRLMAERPSLGILIISGYSSDSAQGELADQLNSQLNFLAKPFDLASLRHSLAQLQISELDKPEP